MLADWLSALFSIERGAIAAIAFICGAGTWILRGQLYNPMLGFAIHPLLTLLCVVIFALLRVGGLIEPMILTDCIKGVLVSTMMGHGIGLALGMLVLLMINDKSQTTETDLMRRQRQALAPPAYQRQARQRR
jgi:hypothetical protein